MTESEGQGAEGSKPGVRHLGMRARLLLAFFGISAFAILAAAAGNYAFRQVGNRLESIAARVPQVISSMEVSRAADRLMASTPALLAAATTTERDRISQRMQPELDRLAAALASIERGSSTGESATAIQPLVGSFQSNLAKLEILVALRLETRERLARLLQSAFQANRDTQALLAPWFQIMEMQINRFFEDSRKPGAEPGAQASSDLATSITRERSVQTAQRGFSSVVEELVQTATTGAKSRLPVVGFETNRSLADLETQAKDLDPKLRPLFIDQVARVRKLAIGPDAILTVRAQELDLIDQAQHLLAENANLSARLDAAVSRLVSDRQSDIVSATGNAISVERLSARILLVLAGLSLIGSVLIVWLYVGRNVIRRLMRLNESMLAIAAGKHHEPIDPSGTDEIAEMGRVVEIFRKNTLERDALLGERAQAAERLEQQVKERTAELAQSVKELRALGEVTKAVNSTVDLETVLTTIVAKATQLSDTEAGGVYVLDNVRHEFWLRATWGLPEPIVAQLRNHPIRMGQTAMSEAVQQRTPIQIPDVQVDPSVTLDIIVRAGFRALIYVPLVGTDTIIGVLIVRRRRPGQFSAGTVELLQTFAGQSALAIQNASLFESVQARTRELAQSLVDLRSTQARLVQTEKLASLGQLTAGIAHEIKNPLNFVNNFSALSAELVDELSEVLDETNLDEKKRDELDGIGKMLKSNLGKVVQHGKRADSIVKNMLLHSRSGVGEHRPVEINAIIDESLNLAYHGARAEKRDFNIALERDFDPAIGVADVFPQEITRVFVNLISNGFYAVAKRSSEAGDGFEPALKAVTRNLGDKVEIRIRDNGTGISPEVREKIFNPFFTTKPTGEGTGLGLSISHDIVVKQHGGTIDVVTEPGSFTEFIVTLPRTMPEQASAAEKN